MTFESWHVCVVKGKSISTNSMVEGKHHEKIVQCMYNTKHNLSIDSRNLTWDHQAPNHLDPASFYKCYVST
jgi:hypothetical protein